MRQFYCERCNGLFNQVGMGRPRRYCDGCRGALSKPVDLGPAPVSAKASTGGEPKVRFDNGTLGAREKLDLALSVLRDVAAGLPRHQEAIEAVRLIG